MKKLVLSEIKCQPKAKRIIKAMLDLGWIFTEWSFNHGNIVYRNGKDNIYEYHFDTEKNLSYEEIIQILKNGQRALVNRTISETMSSLIGNFPKYEIYGNEKLDVHYV